MEKTDNPYSILGLSEDADEGTIKKTYFQLAKKWHPDKQKTDADREAATKTFAKIADAYDLLQDPVRRYDWRQANQSQSISTPSAPAASKATGRQRRSLSPRCSNSNAPKRANSNHSTSTMPQSKRPSVQPNSVRVSPVSSTNPRARPTVRVPPPGSSVPPAPPSRRSGGRSPGRTSGKSPLRGSGSGRSPARNSGRSPLRGSGSRSPPPTRNSGRSPTRNPVGSPRISSKSPTRTSGGTSGVKPVKRSSSAIVLGSYVKQSVRRPHPANERGRALAPAGSLTITNGAQTMNRPSPGRPGRKKSRPSSIGRKPRNGLDSHSEHGPRSKPGERRRRLKRTSSLKLQ